MYLYFRSQIKTQMKRKAFEEAGVSLAQPEKQAKLEQAQLESPPARVQQDGERCFFFSFFILTRVILKQLHVDIIFRSNVKRYER